MISLAWEDTRFSTRTTTEMAWNGWKCDLEIGHTTRLEQDLSHIFTKSMFKQGLQLGESKASSEEEEDDFIY